MFFFVLNSENIKCTRVGLEFI